MTKLLSKTADQPKNEIVGEALAAAEEEGRNFIVLNVWETTVLDYCMPDVFVLPVGKDHGVRANWLFLDVENNVREDFTLQTLIDEYWIRDSDFNYDAQIIAKPLPFNPQPKLDALIQALNAIKKVTDAGLQLLTLPVYDLEKKYVMKTNFLLAPDAEPEDLSCWEELDPGKTEPNGFTLENVLSVGTLMPSDFDWTSQKLVYLDDEDEFCSFLSEPEKFRASLNQE